ncbi:lactonase family protein [Streptomyces sp. M2CJ-2]|uniref:lactonase family protein n=1 Tax=Streptomyces sp. M2CJ-2 TaxID=2803948 RepID=UPI0019242659|nr:lactonase family protein [Streptomyces sp. M2CJ-2]MBL3664764.1 lactonase family protein [Streptomyces sp. M2CJ-2]
MTDGRRRAFIGSFTAAGGPGIVTASVAPDDGALTVLGTLNDLPDPSCLALSPDARTLYAVSETAEGAVAAYRVSGAGAGAGDVPESAGSPVPVHANGPTHLCVFAGHVLTADYGSGSVTAVPVRADGGLGRSASGVFRHTGSGPHPQRQQGPHTHQVLPDPSGRWAVGVDLGTDSVRVYTLVDGAPAQHREVALRPGSGPRHLAFHPDGTHAYVLNELSPTLVVCRWDAVEGALRPLTEIPVLPGAPTGDAYPSGVAVSPDGRFVWTATRGEDVLSVLAVEGNAEGAAGLRLAATVPCGGHWPRALTESRGFLYVANERSGDVTWFAVDPDTGVPRRGGAIPVAAASCVVVG